MYFKNKLLILLSSIAFVISSMPAMAVELGNDSYTIATDGTFVDITNSTYKETGEWADFEYVGFDNKKVRVSQGEGASAMWTQSISPQGKYEIYFWKNIIPEGDKNATVICASNVNSATIGVDFSRGESGWCRIGAVDIPDSFFSVEVRASEEGKIAASCYRIVPTDEATFNFDRIYDENPDAMIFKIGSDKAFYGHNEHTIPDVCPQIINNKTMLPLRFVSENMGAKVSWNNDEKAAYINYDGHEIVFYIGKKEYMVDGVIKMLEEAPSLINSRTVIPMRAFSESLGKEVIWHESGVIIVADKVEMSTDFSEKFYTACETVFSE